MVMLLTGKEWPHSSRLAARIDPRLRCAPVNLPKVPSVAEGLALRVTLLCSPAPSHAWKR
jgi:hypothetical protein